MTTPTASTPWRLAGQPLAAGFFRNASFGAFRKVAQHEPAFRDHVTRTAAALGRDRAWVMAKLCGRWPDGRLLLPDGVAEPAATLHLPAAAPSAGQHLGGPTPFVSSRGTTCLLNLSQPALRALADGAIFVADNVDATAAG